MAGESRMRREAEEAPERCTQQIRAHDGPMRALADRLRALDPPFVATLGRGSSGNAAAFGRVLIETRLRLPALELAPSTALYGAVSPKMRGAVLIVVSQSGRSPDLIQATRAARAQGALIVTLTNADDSPLADLADVPLPLLAGPEGSVAATKSVLTSMSALAHLVALWGRDAALHAALRAVESPLRAACAIDWSAALPPLTRRERLLVLGRGLTLPVAREAALKLKEVAGIQAEAFSTAEVAHGPATLAGAGDPVLVFAPRDIARTGLRDRLAALAAQGAVPLILGPAAGLAKTAADGCLALPGALPHRASAPEPDDPPAAQPGRAATNRPRPADPMPVLAAMADLLSFYRLADTLARARGRDPDHPPFLSKVTRTL